MKPKFTLPKNTTQKKQKGSLEELLTEVSHGQYENFRKWLNEQKCVDLDLSSKAKTINLNHLVKSLDGTPVKTLKLNSNNINNARVKELVQGLEGSSLQALYLNQNNIGVEGVKNLAQVLKKSSITVLDLSKNRIGNKAFKFLVEGLKGSKVTDINLSANKLSGAGVESWGKDLKETSITTINLYWNNLGDRGVINFVKGLKGSLVTSIDLGTTSISPAIATELAEALKETAITRLGFASNNLGSIGAKNLIEGLKDSNVIEINLSHNQIGVQAKVFIEALKRAPLKKMNLALNSFQSSDMGELSNAIKESGIICLNLSYNFINDEGAQILAQCFKQSSLRRIGLTNSHLSRFGIEFLVKSLEGSPITMIELSQDRIPMDPDLIASLVPLISKTLLLKMHIGVDSPEINEVLKMNQKKLLRTPYAITCLRQMAEDEKDHYCNLPALSKTLTKEEDIKEEELKYAGGIVMNSNLPEEVSQHIIGFLPLMDVKKANAYAELAYTKHSEGLEIENKKGEEIAKLNPI